MGGSRGQCVGREVGVGVGCRVPSPRTRLLSIKWLGSSDIYYIGVAAAEWWELLQTLPRDATGLSSRSSRDGRVSKWEMAFQRVRFLLFVAIIRSSLVSVSRFSFPFFFAR